jgi:hypothetical protein
MAKSYTTDNGPIDPPKEGNNKVIADFFIPGCCTFDDDCNPMCMTEEEMKELAIPPFAKSDYITTTQNTKVNIYAFLNDDPLYGDKIEIANGMFQEITAQRGRVSLSFDKKFFIYQPFNNYVGKDEFNYVIRNSVNGLTDSATVYIDITEADVNVTVEPTLTVQPTICGGAKSAFIPVIITPGSYTTSVFTIQGETSLPWLVKEINNGVPEYLINPAKFTQSTTITLQLVRDGAPTGITAVFDVVVVVANFEYELSMVSQTRYTTKTDFGLISGKDPLGRIIQPLSLVRIQLQNTSSPEAVSFNWSLIDNEDNVLLTVNKNDRADFFWTVNESLLLTGFKIQLVAYSQTGCMDIQSQFITSRIK